MLADLCPARQILRVSGADRINFLQGLVTNDVARLADGLVYAALLSPQGKYLADFFLVPAEDAVMIDAAAVQATALFQRLSMYKLRADVAIEAVEMPVYRGVGDMPEGAMGDPRVLELGWRYYGAFEATTASIDWDALRVAHCVPEAGAELTSGDGYILESGFERLNGVDFKKGCYVGQEVTARMKHKTELRKGLAIVETDGTADVGTEITSNGKPTGALFTQSGGRGIAYLRFDRAGVNMTAGKARVSYRTSGDT